MEKDLETLLTEKLSAKKAKRDAILTEYSEMKKKNGRLLVEQRLERLERLAGIEAE